MFAKDVFIMEHNHMIYLVISCTPTKFASCIRHIGRVKYNHAAISLDKDLSKLYSFARPYHCGIFMGGLVTESYESYTLNKSKNVPIVMFAIPVTDEQYNTVRLIISDIKNDHEYMYNLFSVLSYPLTKGFGTYKAFSCVEFVVYLLNMLGYCLDKPRWSYKPDDFLNVFSENIVYTGDIRKYIAKSHNPMYFRPINKVVVFDNTRGLYKILVRSLSHRNYPKAFKKLFLNIWHI